MSCPPRCRSNPCRFCCPARIAFSTRRWSFLARFFPSPRVRVCSIPLACHRISHFTVDRLREDAGLPLVHLLRHRLQQVLGASAGCRPHEGARHAGDWLCRLDCFLTAPRLSDLWCGVFSNCGAPRLPRSLDYSQPRRAPSWLCLMAVRSRGKRAGSR